MVSLTLVLLFAGSGCDGADRNPSGEPSTSGTPSVADGTYSSEPSEEPSTSGTPRVADGRYSGYLTALEASTVTWDQFQFLTGEDAKRAWAEDHPGEEGGPIHDYYIVDDDPGQTTLPVAADAHVKVHDLPAARPTPFTIDFAQLSSHITDDPSKGDDRLWPMPFWFTVSDGKVTAIEEQYMP